MSSKAFENCVFKEWNLFYGCVTGATARAKLRELKQTDPVFWNELTNKRSEDDVPPENIPQPEDDIAVDDGEIGQTLDDSDVPLKVLVQKLVGQPRKTKGYVISDDGGIASNVLAEQFEEVMVRESDINNGGDKQLGRGKRRKQANRLYSANSFWMHGDDSSDDDI
jgi:hypothetical protein